MNTTQTPISLDLDSVLDRYFDPEQTLHRLASQLGVSLLSLSEFLEQAHVRQAIRRIRQMFRRRTPHLIEASLERNLRLMDSVTKIPENPTPADRDRLRREIETSRRVADLYRKMATPPTTAKRSGKPPTTRTVAPASAPVSARIPSATPPSVASSSSSPSTHPVHTHQASPDRPPTSLHSGALAPAA